MKHRLIVLMAICWAALEALYDISAQDLITEVSIERIRQIGQWGGPLHDKEHSARTWTLILAKHLGKMAAETI